MSELSPAGGSEGYGACFDDARRGLSAGRLNKTSGRPSRQAIYEKPLKICEAYQKDRYETITIGRDML